MFVETNIEESYVLRVNNGHNQKVIGIHGQQVINLFECILNEAEKTLLCKGLKFCPTQTVTDVGAGEVKKKLDEFHNKLEKW